MLGQGGAPSGGGFMAAKTDSPSGNSRNLMPVTVRQLLECQEDVFKLEGVEAKVITFVGLVKSVKGSTSKVSLYIDDQTGTIECVTYVGIDDEQSGSKPALMCVGTYVRIFGALRSAMGQKYVLVYRSEPITDLNELTCHILEVLQAPIKLKQLRTAEEPNEPQGGQPLDNTWDNFILCAVGENATGGNTTGGNTTGGNTVGGCIQGLTANQKLIREIISTVKDENGVQREQVIAAVENRVAMEEVMEILEFLSNEGHVYSTVDDDHYKATEQ